MWLSIGPRKNSSIKILIFINGLFERTEKALLIGIAFLHLHRGFLTTGAVLLIRLIAIETATEDQGREQGAGKE